MDDKLQMMKIRFQNFQTAYCTCIALKEEVAKLISKTEDISTQEALARINERTEAIKEELKAMEESLKESQQ